mmetsp:Transcript_11391/g.9012  ORF Transcript_11391/g.9012 Transcript_11391/m.9012 type:complete len:134 (-) Transcript_11391:111-512(-)
MGEDRLATEVYSFSSVLASLVAFAGWLVWVTLPDDILVRWGITYYPDKWWALAMPTYIVTLYAFITVAYIALNMMSSCPLHSEDLLSDSSTPVTGQLFGWPASRSDEGALPDIQDVDLAVVNQYLFLDRHARE